MIHSPLGLDIRALEAVSPAARIVRAGQIDMAMNNRVTVQDAALRARLIEARANARRGAIETAARRRAGLAGLRSVTHATDEAVARALRWLVDAQAYERQLIAALRNQLCAWAEGALREIVGAQDAAALIAAPINARLAQAAHLTDWQLRVAPAMLGEVSARFEHTSLQCIADERLTETEALMQSGALILHIDIARHLDQVIDAMRDAMRRGDAAAASTKNGASARSPATKDGVLAHALAGDMARKNP